MQIDFRQDAQQTSLALQQQQGAHVLAIDVQDVERIEVGPLATE